MSTAKKLLDALKEAGLHVSFVESLTGGAICDALVSCAGASAVLGASFVTYSNEAKADLVHVSRESLASHGAVSAEVASEMAEGGRLRASADLCVSATGVAGPDGGSKEKPVGLVYLGRSYQGEVQTKRCLFQGDRQAIRAQTVEAALCFALEALREDPADSFS